MPTTLRILVVLLLMGSQGCVFRASTRDVQTAALNPTYVRPIVAQRSVVPLVLVCDPSELPDEVPLDGPAGMPPGRLLGARALVTEHLRRGLEALFERVQVVDDPAKVPVEAMAGKVQFVGIGLMISPSGVTVVGTLEWAISLTRPGEGQPFYGWAERTTGTREGAGSFGKLDPALPVQGAIEASLRDMLKDMADKGVAAPAVAQASTSGS